MGGEKGEDGADAGLGGASQDVRSRDGAREAVRDRRIAEWRRSREALEPELTPGAVGRGGAGRGAGPWHHAGVNWPVRTFNGFRRGSQVRNGQTLQPPPLDSPYVPMAPQPQPQQPPTLPPRPQLPPQPSPSQRPPAPQLHPPQSPLRPPPPALPASQPRQLQQQRPSLRPTLPPLLPQPAPAPQQQSQGIPAHQEGVRLGGVLPGGRALRVPPPAVAAGGNEGRAEELRDGGRRRADGIDPSNAQLQPRRAQSQTTAESRRRNAATSAASLAEGLPPSTALTFSVDVSVGCTYTRDDDFASGLPLTRPYVYQPFLRPARSDDFRAFVAWARRTSLGEEDVRTVDVFAVQASAGDGPPVVLLLFSGATRDGDIASHLRAAGAIVLAVDILVGGRFHDLADHSAEGIALHLVRACERGEFDAVHSAPPCTTWTVARELGDQMRTVVHPWGVPGLPVDMAEQCRLANALLILTFDISLLVVASGGEATIEQPATRSDPDEPRTFWPAKAREGHASVFAMSGGELAIRMVREYAASTDSRIITTPLCAFGAPWQKYVSVLASPGAAKVLEPAHSYRCSHGSHDAHAHGWGSAELSAAYPSSFCLLVACALLRAEVAPTPSQGVDGGFGADVKDSRVAATTAPGYEESSPGWWNDDDDLSEDGCDEHEALFGSGVSVYKACVKSKVKYSTEEGGELRRHAIPNSYEEAMCHESAAELWRAMLTEMDAHEDCRTWDIRPASECYDAGRQPIGCRWVYDAKLCQSTNVLLLWKARLVARGDQMVWMRDFFETYAGVCRLSTFRIFLALAAIWSLVLTGADVSTAYLHAPLRDCEVWMRSPEGFPMRMPDGTPALLRLRMALYGLRQSAREWATTLREWLLAWKYKGHNTFRRLESDSYVFLWRRQEGTVLVLLWVDDIFMGHSCAEMRRVFMEAFKQRFRVKDLGLLRQGLGMDIQQDLEMGTVSFSQSRYIRDAARRFDVHADNAWADIPVPVALAKAVRAAVPTDAEREQYSDTCRVLGGIIVHVASTSRPDVAVGAQLISAAPPSELRQRLSKRILGYLARTADLRITYSKSASAELQCAFSSMTGEDDTSRATAPWMAVDADHASDRSYTGWLLMLAGALVAWAMRAQPLPSLSSTEAELYGLSTAVCDLLTVVNFLEEVGYDVTAAVPVFCDSRGARLLVADCAAPARTRHIHRRWYFVRHYKDAGRITVKEIKGINNPANFLTKPVGGAVFARDRSRAMGMR